MTSAPTTLSPASIIVANWREKIWSDFGLTGLPNEPIDLFATPPPWSTSFSDFASRPLTRSCSRAASRSFALMTPSISRPWALIAVYPYEAICLSYRQAFGRAEGLPERGIEDGRFPGEDARRVLGIANDDGHLLGPLTAGRLNEVDVGVERVPLPVRADHRLGRLDGARRRRHGRAAVRGADRRGHRRERAEVRGRPRRGRERQRRRGRHAGVRARREVRLREGVRGDHPVGCP